MKRWGEGGAARGRFEVFAEPQWVGGGRWRVARARARQELAGKQGALRMAVLFARAALFSRRNCGALVDV